MTTQNQSDLQKAVENVKPSDLADNLDPKTTLDPKHNEGQTPENLSNNEATPFIDASVRTDT